MPHLRGRFGTVAVSICLLAACAPGSAGARQAPAASYRGAVAAMQRGDHAEAERQLLIVAQGAPDHPFVLHQLARAQARAGHPDAAAVSLARALERGAGYDADRDSAFASLWPRPEFAPLRRAIEERRRPVSTSRTGFVIRERDLIPEGIAYDPRLDRMLLGSLHKGKIVAVPLGGRDSVRDPVAFASLPVPVVVGLKVDADRRRVWAAAGTNEAASPADRRGQGVLFALHADSGTVLQSWTLGGPSERHFFNDIVVASGGDAYLTDTEAGAVYRARVGSPDLDVVAAPGSHPFANGIALSEDERLLYVATGQGLAFVKLEGRQSAPLPGPEPLLGVDGLVRHGSDLIAIQNVGGLARVVRVVLAPDGRAVRRIDILEANHPLFEALPTTGTIAGDDFYFIANSQVNRVGPDGSIPPGASLGDPVILRAPLGPATRR
jgi:hypothetical protein